MDKQRICKICNRRFSNGKAMGGHMRSHLAKLPIPPKPPQSQSPSSSSSSSSYSSLLSLPNNTTNNEEEAESTRPSNRPTRRRSKRRRKEGADKSAANDKPLSSLYDTFFSEEEVALCLIMLSKDQWKNKNGVFDDEEEDDHDHDHEDENEEEEEEEEEEEDEVDEEEEEEEGVLVSTSRTRGRNHHQFKCETCNKVFRSYQALGGHRASHKKITIKTQSLDEVNNGINNGAKYVVERRTFECPFCYKVFESGQALGGHKKVHFSTHLSNNARNTASSSANKFRDNLVIDLNLPAPEEEAGHDDDDDDDEEVVTHESLSDY